MNFFHPKMQMCPQEVYLHVQAGLQWGWVTLGKIIALNFYASDGFIIMGEDNTGQKPLYHCHSPPTPQIRMLSL